MKRRRLLPVSHQQIVLILTLLLFSACVPSVPMYLENEEGTVKLGGETLVLMSLRVSNQFKESFQPDMKKVCLLDASGNRLNVNIVKTHEPTDKTSNFYLINFKLPSDEYTIDKLIGVKMVPFLLNAKCLFEVNETVKLQSNEIVYLGAIDCMIREKTGEANEPSAGPVTPLIDQAVAGFSTGTYDLIIMDSYDVDMMMFKDRFPFLEGEDVVNRTLE